MGVAECALEKGVCVGGGGGQLGVRERGGEGEAS